MRACVTKVGRDASFREFESQLCELANEATRRNLAIRLQEVADGHGEQLLIEGKRYRRHQPGEVDYHTLCGKVSVRRWTYREIGVRNGPTVVPLELAAGLIHRATPALSYSIALGYSHGPMRHYDKQMRAAHRAPPPRATLERIATYVGGCAAQDVVKIEADIRRLEPVPAQAHALAVSLDRTTVAMAEQRPPGRPPNSRRKRRKRPYQRRPPPPIDVNWRMPYVGTVSVVGADGEAITIRKYHATPEEGPTKITARMMADVAHCRSRRNLPVVVVQDGAPEMWNEIRPALRKAGVAKWNEVIDRFHLNERLSAALHVIDRNPVSRRQHYEKWQQRLDRSDRAICEIHKWIERQMVARTCRYKLQDHVNYIFNYTHMMKYASLRRRRLPIASGIVEGACKSLVARRAKGSGQRWKPAGLTGVLTLRALEQSDRFSSFWERFIKRFRADIRAAA
jgi:hypothetical protein